MGIVEIKRKFENKNFFLFIFNCLSYGKHEEGFK